MERDTAHDHVTMTVEKYSKYAAKLRVYTKELVTRDMRVDRGKIMKYDVSRPLHNESCHDV